MTVHVLMVNICRSADYIHVSKNIAVCCKCAIIIFIKGPHRISLRSYWRPWRWEAATCIYRIFSCIKDQCLSTHTSTMMDLTMTLLLAAIFPVITVMAPGVSWWWKLVEKFITTRIPRLTGFYWGQLFLNVQCKSTNDCMGIKPTVCVQDVYINGHVEIYKYYLWMGVCLCIHPIFT